MDENHHMADGVRGAYAELIDSWRAHPEIDSEVKPHLYHMFAVQEGERSGLPTRYTGRTLSLSEDARQLYYLIDAAEDWPEAAEVVVLHPETNRVFWLDDVEAWQEIGAGATPEEQVTLLGWRKSPGGNWRHDGITEPLPEWDTADTIELALESSRKGALVDRNPIVRNAEGNLVPGEDPADNQADNAPLPEIDAAGVLALLVDGKTFRQFTEMDWSCYAGATAGSVISYSVPEHENWVFIVGPSDIRESDPFNVYAELLTEELTMTAYQLIKGGWESVG